MLFRSNCSKERVENALISTGIENLKEMAADSKNTEVDCHFCNKKYVFTPEDIKKLIDNAVK